MVIVYIYILINELIEVLNYVGRVPFGSIIDVKV